MPNININSTDPTEIKSFQCERLRKELRNRGLSGNGHKNKLVERIVKSNEKRKALDAVSLSRPTKKRTISHLHKNIANNNFSSSGKDPASCLPKDIVVSIMCFLDVEDVVTCSRLNRSWNAISNIPILWKFLFVQYYSNETSQTSQVEDWKKNFAETYFKSIIMSKTQENSVSFYRINSTRTACYYCRTLVENDTFGTYIDTGSMSYPCVHASCYLKYHRLSFFPNDTNLSEESLKEIARWILHGLPGESTPSVLGPAQSWRKNLGPKKKRK